MEWRARAHCIIERFPELKCKTDMLTSEEVLALKSVRNAIDTTSRYSNAKERLHVVDMVYWQKICTLRGAAMRIRYSYDTVQEWHADFISLVDAYYRVLGENERENADM